MQVGGEIEQHASRQHQRRMDLLHQPEQKGRKEHEQHIRLQKPPCAAIRLFQQQHMGNHVPRRARDLLSHAEQEPRRAGEQEDDPVIAQQLQNPEAVLPPIAAAAVLKAVKQAVAAAKSVDRHTDFREQRKIINQRGISHAEIYVIIIRRVRPAEQVQKQHEKNRQALRELHLVFGQLARRGGGILRHFLRLLLRYFAGVVCCFFRFLSSGSTVQA